MKYKDIVECAKKVIYNVENKQTASINRTRNYTTLAYVFSNAITRIGRDAGIKKIKENNKKVGYPIDKNIGKKEYLDACKWYVEWCNTHNYTAPSYVKIDKGINVWVWTYTTAKIIVYYNLHKELPNYVYTTNKYFRKPVTEDEVYNYFTKVFGKVSTIDEALEKIQSRGYGYYYDDRYSNKESIDRMKNGYGVNCTDSCHVFYHIGKALGYDVRAIHVLCRGGDGHIRLQLRHKTHTGNTWINRDPASCLNGNDVTDIWCSNGTYLSTNPDWFLENLNR